MSHGPDESGNPILQSCCVREEEGGDEDEPFESSREHRLCGQTRNPLPAATGSSLSDPCSHRKYILLEVVVQRQVPLSSGGETATG